MLSKSQAVLLMFSATVNPKAFFFSFDSLYEFLWYGIKVVLSLICATLPSAVKN